MADEVYSVFPDPQGASHPDRMRPPENPKQMIDAARRDITFNFAWESRDDGWYCHVCAPGGYKIRRGASPEMHESQRNPDTHIRNLSWWIIRWFEKKGLPLPKWPDCYSDRHNQLWCFICRRDCGLYGRESGERHDAEHLRMEWDVMRPGRLEPRFSKRTGGRQRQAHFLDEILRSREVGYDPGREAAAARGEFGDVPDPTRAPAVEGSFTARPGSGIMDRMSYMSTEVPGERLHIVQTEEGVKQVTSAHLDEWVEIPNIHGEVTRWRRACDYGKHASLGKDGPVRPCIGEGCQCDCHNETDKQLRGYEREEPTP